ncbi:unnamed protein product [Cuscuta epithymum]|uniref:Uncharacterized protein n=1 Tax=Cuscuta epithymum TaxID=186058 RepID=A0AAV0F9Z5_9ASTE|nr:unnamed protein product [Cuscuta epithymum]
MEYMAQEPPAHRLLFLLHKSIELRKQLRPKYNGPSLKVAQNTHWGAFGLLGRRLQNSQDSLLWHKKLLGENRRRREPSAFSCPQHQGKPSAEPSLRLHEEPPATQGALGYTRSLRLHEEPSAERAQSSKIPFRDSQPPHLMPRRIRQPHSMRLTYHCRCH